MINKRFRWCLVFIVLAMSSLEARSGWGKTQTRFEKEGVLWNQVFLDFNGISFIGVMPNYTGTFFDQGMIIYTGNVANQYAYMMMALDFQTVHSEEEFLKLVREKNPYYTVQEVDGKRFGAKYAAFLTPTIQEMTSFWLVCLTREDQLIKIGSDDIDEERRAFFFENLTIQ